jgi:hypothetical protein
MKTPSLHLNSRMEENFREDGAGNKNFKYDHQKEKNER